MSHGVEFKPRAAPPRDERASLIAAADHLVEFGDSLVEEEMRLRTEQTAFWRRVSIGVEARLLKLTKYEGPKRPIGRPRKER